MAQHFKPTFLMACAAMICSTAFSQSFKSYYNSADGEMYTDLKTALYEIVSNHKVYTYSALWKCYETTDACLDNPNQVFDMYSDEVFYFPGNGNAPSGMNKEHVAPQSWWGSGAKYPIYSDLFNVYPSEARANSAKSNLPLGVVTGSITFSNSRCRVGTATLSGGAGKVFEPCDEFKGDFARIYMYDAVCYQNVPWQSNYGWAFKAGGSNYPTFNEWIIPIMLEWNRMDPPSEWEVIRNERVYQMQNNRNPFIDYPQLAEYIWGDSINFAWNLATAVPNVISAKTDTATVDPTPPDTIPVDTIPVDTTGIDIPDIAADTLIFNETFESAASGNNTSTGGASATWKVNEQFTVATACYEAGGALKLGTSSKSGNLTTVAIPAKAGSKLRVEVDIKGWTKVEGELLLSITGVAEPQSLSYEATMTSNFETVSATFENIPQENPQLTLVTSAKRCFIDAIRIYNLKKAAAPDEEIDEERKHLLEICDMDGDGKITTADIAILIQIYLQRQP